jgi:hypothetical protein
VQKAKQKLTFMMVRNAGDALCGISEPGGAHSQSGGGVLWRRNQVNSIKMRRNGARKLT